MVAREIRAMDRDEVLKLLKGGLKGITEWDRRRKAGEEIPDLGADFSAVTSAPGGR